MAVIDWSNTRPALSPKRASWRGSAAKALTTRTPETFSSTSAVSSAMRCWTSCRAGRERCPNRAAISTTNGTGISDSAASSGCSRNIATAASTIVRPLCVMKMSP